MKAAPSHLDERQFAYAVRELANSIVFGSELSASVGQGTEYAQARMYQPGDPIRAIDWRATARAGRTIVKQYESLRRMPLMIVMDRSPTMIATSCATSKRDWAHLLAPAMALAGQRQSAPAGLVSFGPDHGRPGRPLCLAPTLSGDSVRNTFRPGATTISAAADAPAAFAWIEQTIHEKATIIVLSDFQHPLLPRAMKSAAGRHEVLAIQLADPIEDSRLPAGVYRAVGAMAGEAKLIARGIDNRALPALADLRRSGIAGIRLPIDRPFVPALRSFLADAARPVGGRP